MGFFGRLRSRRASSQQDWTGWRLEELEHHMLRVQLPSRFDDLPRAHHDALAKTLGEELLSWVDLDDTEIVIDMLTAGTANELAAKLESAGLPTSSQVAYRYYAHRPVPIRVPYVDDATEPQMMRVALEMKAAGVPVTTKQVAEDDAARLVRGPMLMELDAL